MKKKTKRLVARQGLSLLLVAALVLQGFAFVRTPTSVRASSQLQGELKRVIVRYRGDAAIANSQNTLSEQVADLQQRQDWLDRQFDQSAGYKEVIHATSQLPFLLMNVDAVGEQSLRNNPNILSVEEDQLLKTGMMDAITLIGGSVATGFSDGTDDFTGDNTVIAVVDDGVDKTHTAFAGAVVSEACFSVPTTEYSNATVSSACPGGVTSTTAADSGLPCDDVADCVHGTAVAGAALMRGISASIDRDGAGPGASETVNLSGSAKDSDLIAIMAQMKVTEKVGQSDICGDVGVQTEECYRPSTGLGVVAMGRVLELQNSGSLAGKIVASNFSVGSSTDFYSDEALCAAGSADAQAYNVAAAALRYANVAPIVAAGNSGAGVNQNEISTPGCLSNVIGVSASSKTDEMASYSNAGPLTDLVAPGGDYSGSGDGFAQLLLLPKPGDELELVQGTSFAAPMTAGAWAVIREKAPTATVSTVLELLKDTGVSITEARSGYTAMTHKRIALDDALAAAEDLPAITTVTVSAQDIVGGTTVPITVDTVNATTCQAFSGSSSVATINISAGTGTLNVTAPTSVGEATYKIECSDANSNAAQRNAVFTVATAGTTPDDQTPAPILDDGGQSDWVPGVPNAGAVLRTRILVSMAVCLLALVMLQRNILFGRRRSRA